jgi:hypothetical protein
MDIQGDFSADDIRDITVQEAVEGFLAISVITLSLAFVVSKLVGASTTLPLVGVFYAVLPVSMVMLGFLTYRVTRMIYDQHSMRSVQLLPKVLMALVLSVAALNIGFIMVASGPMVSGTLGTLRTSILIVLLSMALSVSVLSRNLIEVTE